MNTTGHEYLICWNRKRVGQSLAAPLIAGICLSLATGSLAASNEERLLKDAERVLEMVDKLDKHEKIMGSPHTWAAVGDWQGWDPANAATQMFDSGGGIYVL